MDSSDKDSSFEEHSLEQLLAQRQQLMQELIHDADATDNSQAPLSHTDDIGSDSSMDGRMMLEAMKSMEGDRLSPINCKLKTRKRKSSHFDNGPTDSNKLVRTDDVSDDLNTETVSSSCPYRSSSGHVIAGDSDSDNDNHNSTPSNHSEQMVQEISATGEDGDDDSDVDVEQLLEGPYARSETKRPNGIRVPPPREKLVLKYRNAECFEVLPNGWKELTHRSGLPVYLHMQSRVCTFSRPYFLGPGSVRNHDVPLAAIPCLHQSRLRHDMDERRKEHEKNGMGKNLELLGAPDTQVQTLSEFAKRHLTSDQLNQYATPKFEFEKLQIRRFDKWADHRTHTNWVRDKVEATEALIGRPSLPSSVRLITVPYMDNSAKPRNRSFILNPQGKTCIAVLHEYVQKVLKSHVMYEFGEISSAAKPYSATIKLSANKNNKNIANANNGCAPSLPANNNHNSKDKDDQVWVSFGTGYGNSKKAAKMDAAKQALAVLVPGIDFGEDGLAHDQDSSDPASKIFDMISVTDTRVPELSAKAGQPPPFLILQECLKRNAAFGDTQVDTKVTRIKHQRHEFSMTCGKHVVEVVCSNKKEGKQKASQAMLDKLHPHVKMWGALIRLYGYGAQKKVVDCRKQKDSIIKLQANSKESASLLEPNEAILDKLRMEMKGLYSEPDKSGSTGLCLGSTPFKNKRSSTIADFSAVHSIDI